MKNRLQWLYDEYKSEMNSTEKETCAHQAYMKNLAMEMAAIETLMKSDIDEHIKMDTRMMKKHHSEVSHQDKWHEALSEQNWKWVVFQRFEDEVKDACMDIEAMKAATMHGKSVVADAMKVMAAQRVKNSETLAALYNTLPYTHGTDVQQKKWDTEFIVVMEMHKKNVEALTLTK